MMFYYQIDWTRTWYDSGVWFTQHPELLLKCSGQFVYNSYLGYVRSFIFNTRSLSSCCFFYDTEDNEDELVVYLHITRMLALWVHCGRISENHCDLHSPLAMLMQVSPETSSPGDSSPASLLCSCCCWRSCIGMFRLAVPVSCPGLLRLLPPDTLSSRRRKSS